MWGVYLKAYYSVSLLSYVNASKNALMERCAICPKLPTLKMYAVTKLIKLNCCTVVAN